MTLDIIKIIFNGLSRLPLSPTLIQFDPKTLRMNKYNPPNPTVFFFYVSNNVLGMHLSHLHILTQSNPNVSLKHHLTRKKKLMSLG